MNEAIRNQYDSLYATEKVVLGGGKPVAVVCKLEDYIQAGTVFDIGGGEGRNALYLAEKGFAVTVADISAVGISKLEASAKEKDLEIRTKVSDILVDRIDEVYDIFVMSFVLHHMDIDDVKRVIREAQKQTTEKGAHVISTFMNKGDLYERGNNSARFYPSGKVLRELYHDWDIKELTTYEAKTLARDKSDNRMKNHVVDLIAIKK